MAELTSILDAIVNCAECHQPFRAGDAEDSDDEGVPICPECYAKRIEEWPNCEVPDCQYKSCLALNSPRCYPHTVGERLRALRNQPHKQA